MSLMGTATTSRAAALSRLDDATADKGFGAWWFIIASKVLDEIFVNFGGLFVIPLRKVAGGMAGVRQRWTLCASSMQYTRG